MTRTGRADDSSDFRARVNRRLSTPVTVKERLPVSDAPEDRRRERQEKELGSNRTVTNLEHRKEPLDQSGIVEAQGPGFDPGYRLSREPKRL